MTLKRAALAVLTPVLIASSAVVSQNILTTPETTHATTTPDGCFGLQEEAISWYFATEGGTAEGAPCPADVVIPSSIGGMPIKTIKDSAFWLKGITSVTIPNSVTTIEASAFGNNQLTSVTIPNSVTSIGDYAFMNTHLTSLTLPSSLTSINSGAFASNQLTSVSLPDNLISIGEGAFMYNPLASVTIPNSVTSIGASAFYGGNIAELSLSEGITNLGSYAFGSNQLTSLTLPGSLTTLGNAAFYNNKLQSVVIPNGITTIGSNGFSNNLLTSVSLPASLTDIGTGTFSHNQLASITIPNSVADIGAGAFSSNRLTSLTLPSSVTSVGNGAFMNNQLTTLSIPDTVTSLGNYAFEANQLTSVTLGCGVPSLNAELFAMNQLRDVTIPGCVTSINPSAFMGQNPWGGAVDWGYDADHDWYSDDPNVRKTVHDNIWYVVLRTSDASNPNHLSDGVIDEASYTGDLNNDGDETDPIGGHLINAASTSVIYTDNSNNSLLPSKTSTGRLNDETNLTDYLVKNIQTPGFADAYEPTPEEQAALEVSLTPYYRSGQSMSFVAPEVDGYTLQSPNSPYSISLASGSNTIHFVYALPQTNDGTPNPAQPVTPPVAESTTAKPVTHSTIGTSIIPPSKRSGEATLSVPESKRTLVDFTSQSGAFASPTAEAVPSGLAAILANSRLETNEAKSCHEINSAKLLNDTSFSAPDTSYKTVGGLAFVLNCGEVAGDAEITFTLGEAITDLSKVKVYKQNAQGTSTDITSQITLTNQISSGHTTISYTLQDGQSFDDDGVANKSISDPIYIAVPTSTPLYTKVAQEAPLAQNAQQQTDTPTAWMVAAVAAAVAVTALIVVIIRKKRRA